MDDKHDGHWHPTRASFGGDNAGSDQQECEPSSSMEWDTAGFVEQAPASSGDVYSANLLPSPSFEPPFNINVIPQPLFESQTRHDTQVMTMRDSLSFTLDTRTLHEYPNSSQISPSFPDSTADTAAHSRMVDAHVTSPNNRSAELVGPTAASIERRQRRSRSRSTTSSRSHNKRPYSPSSRHEVAVMRQLGACDYCKGKKVKVSLAIPAANYTEANVQCDRRFPWEPDCLAPSQRPNFVRRRTSAPPVPDVTATLVASRGRAISDTSPAANSQLVVQQDPVLASTSFGHHPSLYMASNDCDNNANDLNGVGYGMRDSRHPHHCKLLAPYKILPKLTIADIRNPAALAICFAPVAEDEEEDVRRN